MSDLISTRKEQSEGTDPELRAAVEEFIRPIHNFCTEMNIPRLSMLIVDADTELPLGYMDGVFDTMDECCVRAEMQRVFEFDYTPYIDAMTDTDKRARAFGVLMDLKFRRH